ncbi:hypothetical protein [Chitinimonas koreensis]|uniref:hypothetical protein n=1 Tax=Chitinimonas koreensis TaxID=356302 RepID=UPI0012FA0C33|nr:hypothetical protein [Chitinimonas koreensis]QNM96369.1 hypothetical protein H9L41_21685 [Chitinimonas koreensis]
MKHAWMGMLLLATLAGGAQAAGVGVRAGTTGIGADVGFDLIPTFSGRIGYSKFDYSRDVDETDVHYEGKLKLSNISALVDWHPLGPFRLTAGVVGADNKFVLDGRPTGGTYELNGHNYTAAEIGSVKAEIKGKRRAAPYLGVGYGNVSGFGVNFYGDLGVILQGGSKARVDVTCGSAVPAAQCNQIRTDAAAEQARLQDDLKHFKAWPVLNVGLTIGF